jgi:thiamine-monophosphate kinase
MRRLGEIALIAEYLAPLATSPGSFGLKDDAALLTGIPPAGLVVTTDALVAGVHFFEDDDPGDAAYKALAVNMSDLAAKGAKPLAYTMALALAASPTEDWARRFASGLALGQTKFGIQLLGGDTVSARGAWWLSITAFGEPPARGIVPRGGAKPGDLLYVSGTLGDAALGLKLRLKQAGLDAALPDEEKRFLLSRYLHPEPRLALSPALSAYASAAMDISDGLALDLARMCAASGVSAMVQAGLVPLSKAAQDVLANVPQELNTVLSGGDDYEILAALPTQHATAFEAMAAEANVRVSRMGTVSEGSEPPSFLGEDGKALTLTASGFEHFKT